MNTKCNARKADGTACKFPSWGTSDKCCRHAALAGDVDARARLSAGGRKSQAARAERTEASKLTTASLRNSADLLGVLERELVAVKNSGGEAVAKSGAVVKLVSEARAILKSEFLEKENDQLRAIIDEKFPGIAKHLKAIP